MADRTVSDPEDLTTAVENDQSVIRHHLTSSTNENTPSPLAQMPAGASQPSGTEAQGSSPPNIRKRDFGFLPIPKHRRHDPSRKPEEQFLFSWKLNLVFATTAVSDRYQHHEWDLALIHTSDCLGDEPVLCTAHARSVGRRFFRPPPLTFALLPIARSIASDFNTSNDVVSRIPTLSQAGYGVGILLISPLGDLVRRRQLVLLLMFLTTTLSIGLALSTNVAMLEGLSFVVGMLTVSMSRDIFHAMLTDCVSRYHPKSVYRGQPILRQVIDEHGR